MTLLLQKLTAAIEILIIGHPASLKILTGEVPPPTTEEIAEILGCFKQKNWLSILGCRVDTSSGEAAEEKIYAMAETYFDVIKQAGGWDHIVNVVHAYIRQNRTYWMIFRDYLVWMEKLPSSRRGYVHQGDMISRKYGYTLHHLRNIYKRVPLDLAKAILCFDKMKEEAKR